MEQGPVVAERTRAAQDEVAAAAGRPSTPGATWTAAPAWGREKSGGDGENERKEKEPLFYGCPVATFKT